MATIEGARAMKLDDRIGSLEAGKRADLVAVELGGAGTTPLWDLYSTLVYAVKESSVSLTMVEGKVLWDGKRVTTLDEAKVLRDAGEWRERIAASLATPAAPVAK
jgi:5-methylthioadenosine/S-adenosylhomocysteine deaminase